MAYHISASQTKTVKGCAAKVCFDKVDGVPRTNSKSAQLGTDIHAEVEGHYVDASPTTSAYALALLQNLPARTEADLRPEHEFTFLWPGPDVLVNGFIDLLWLKRKHPEVHDHKSTSKFNLHLTEEELLTDPQAVFYAMEAVLAHNVTYGEPPEYVDVQFGYVDTVPKVRTAPRALPVRQRFTLPIIESGLESLRPQADLLKRIHEERITGKQAAEQGLTDPSQCFKYGPCAFRHQCPTYAEHHVKKAESRMTTPSLDLLASLQALQTASAPEPPEGVRAERAEFTPPELAPFDTSSVQDVIVAVKPADAAPDVSPSDPLPPPLKESKAKGAKAARAAKPKPPEPELVAEPTQPVPEGIVTAEAVLEDSIEACDRFAMALTKCGLRDEAIQFLDLAQKLTETLAEEMNS